MRSPAWRWVRRGVVVVALFAVLDYLVLPQVAGTRQALILLGSIRPWWAVTAVALEALSLVSYSLLTRTVFPDRRPPFSWLIRTDLTTLGVSHVLPGGAAAATTLRYRLLHEGGITAEDAAVGMAVEGVGSGLVLFAVLWLALVASIPLVGVRSLYLAAAAVGAVLLVATPIVVVLRSRRALPTTSVVDRAVGRLPTRFRSRVEQSVQLASGQLSQLLADRPSLRASATWAAGNWVLDAASLWVFLLAYGYVLNPDGLFVSYGIANLVAFIPISPGGLGVIEAVLIPSLVGFGTPRAIAVLGVVSWRLFNFWAPVPTAGLCYLSLRTQKWRKHQEPHGE